MVTPAYPGSFTQNSPWQFSPNIGLSFDPTGDGKTVLRGGFSLGYDQVNFFTSQRNEDNPPFATAISQTQTTTSGPISFSSPWSVGQITTNPFPQPQIPTPLLRSSSLNRNMLSRLPSSILPTPKCGQQAFSGSLDEAGNSRFSTSGATPFICRWELRWEGTERSTFPECGVQMAQGVRVS